MARNRYDIDEVMEDHFDLGQLKRLGHYVLPFKKDMFLAAFLMLSASALTMLIPRFFMTVMNDIIPAGDIRGLFLISFYTLLIILYSVVSLKAKIKITNRVVSICQKKLVNRGFIRGPFLPLYGSGAIMMLLVSSPMKGNLVGIFIAGCLGATVLEYVTGVIMEALFKVRYWDYSHKKFNFRGQICLESSLCWGLLTILMTQFIHKPVESLAMMIPPRVLVLAVAVISVLFIADFVTSFQAAMDLRDILIKAEQARQELERLQKRLDVIIAVANNDREIKREKREERMEELASAIEDTFLQLRDAIPGSELLREKMEEIVELRDKFIGSRRVGEENQQSFIHSFFKRNLLKGNPTMTSHKFYDTLEELKKSASEYRKGKK